MPNPTPHPLGQAAAPDRLGLAVAATRPTPDAARRHERSPWRLPIMLACAGIAAVAAGILAEKFGPESLLREDGPVEWATAALFAIAALGAAVRLRGGRGFDWLALYVLLLASLCCLSELAFGARLFGWDMPDMRGGGELDGAHDLVLVALRTVWEAPLFLAAAVAAAFLALIVVLRSAARAGLSPRALWQWLTSEDRRMTIAAASLYLAAALACDLLEQPALRQVEEPLELLAACLLVVIAKPPQAARRA